MSTDTTTLAVPIRVQQLIQHQRQKHLMEARAIWEWLWTEKQIGLPLVLVRGVCEFQKGQSRSDALWYGEQVVPVDEHVRCPTCHARLSRVPCRVCSLKERMSEDV